jgi:hypothetical protein
MSTRRRTQSASTPSYTRSVDPVPVPVIAKRPDTILGFGETRIHAETATFEVRASKVASRSGAIPIGSGGIWTRGHVSGS